MIFAFSRRESTRSHELAHSGSTLSTVLLALVAFGAGAVLVTVLHRPPQKPVEQTDNTLQLSGATRKILETLNSPVTVRFFSLLDPGASPELSAFAERVKQMLIDYQKSAAGKIDLVVADRANNVSPNQAQADGIAGFDLDRGEGCYLGIALVCQGRKEALPRLSPEWEVALESDISRAIARVSTPPPGSRGAPANTADPVIAQMLSEKIPDASKVSLDEGTRILRTASLAEFSAAVNETQTEVQAAQAQWKQAKSNGSQAQQDAALKHLQDIQNAQSQKLKEIAARSQAEIDLLKQLKSSNP